MDDPRFAAAKRFAEEDDDDGDPEGGRSDGSDGEEAEDSGDEGTEEDEEGQQGASGGEKPTKTKSKSLTELSQKKLERMKASIEKTGIVYISRVPPFMKPTKLKQILSRYAEIGRVYLAPEDSGARARRKKMGGNSGKRFTEGWVEFLDKRKAKTVAAMLNGQQIGGKKRSAYYYDLWTLKYLSKFKWDHLTEEIAYQKAVREQKLALELSAGKRERDFYLKQVDQAKAVAAMEERRKKKGEEGGAGAGAAKAGAGDSAAAAKRERKYFQRQVRADPHADRAVSEKLVSGLFAAKGGGSAAKKRRADDDA